MELKKYACIDNNLVYNASYPLIFDKIMQIDSTMILRILSRDEILCVWILICGHSLF